VLVCSEFTRRELGRLFPHLADRARLVALGPDDDLPPAPQRDEARARLGLAGPTLLTVGSIFNRRCLPELLRATALLARRYPDLRLEVVGENRTHPWQDVHALMDLLGLRGTVRLTGFASERGLAERYAAADVAVFLSEYEGFGLGVLEAMARGVPAVVSARPAMGELYAEAALLVDPRDPGGIAQAVARVLDDRALAADLAARGRALAARYSWRATAAATRAVLAEAAAR
jgi:glycosyltransferase involved in cell wall biosynthesis